MNANHRKKTVASSPAVVHAMASENTAVHEANWFQRLDGVTNSHQLAPSKQKPRRKLPGGKLPGGKLQPLFKDFNGFSQKHNISSGGTEHFSVLPNISSHPLDAHTASLLCGNVTDGALQLEPDSVVIYLSYSCQDMKEERDWLWKTAVPQLRQFCSEYCLTFQLVDIETEISQSSLSFPSTLRTDEISRCQLTSIGPDFVMLLGEDCGSPVAPASIPVAEFEALRDVILQLGLAGFELLETYILDVNKAEYLRKETVDQKTLQDLGTLLHQAASSSAFVFTEEVGRKYLITALEEEAAVGILKRKNPRNHCLCYRRKVGQQSENSTSSNKTSDVLWEKIHQYLGTNNAKCPTVKKGANAVDPAAEQMSYLHRLSAEFVTDIKGMIEQQLVRVFQNRKSPEAAIISEVIHHAGLQMEKLQKFSGDDKLLNRVRAFVRDPKQSCKPFVIHGIPGVGKSTAIAAIGATVQGWFPDGNSVTVTRFLGTSTGAVDVHGLIANVATQVRLAYNVDVSEIVAHQTLHEELTSFRQTLEMVSRSSAHTRPLFILLDGINELSPHRDALEALWAVRRLPSNVHVILSTVSGGAENDNGVDVFGALMALITDIELTYEISPHPSNSRNKPKKLSVDAPTPELLVSTLDSMEKEFGKNTTKYFAAYLSIANVGILETELCDLLSTHHDVVEELSPRPIDNHFPLVLVKILRWHLSRFVDNRLVYGRLGFGWSRNAFRVAAAKRYDIIVSGSNVSLNPEATSFTLMLHEHFANIYVDKESQTSLFDDTATEPEEIENSFVGMTLQTFDAENSVKLNRLPYHLRILLPVEGLDRARQCMLFDFRWLSARLGAAPVFVTLNDIHSFYSLACDMQRESIADDACEDVSVLFEFLQLSSESLILGSHNLAVEIVARLDFFAVKFPSIAELVRQAEQWLGETDRPMLIPLSPSVWTRPGGALRHRMNGPTHVLGLLNAEDIVIGYGQKHGVSVWRLQSGSLVHRFELNPQQSMSGILAGHDGAFVIVSHYSPINQTTDLSVLSTETGIVLFSTTFPREFEALTLSEDDQLVVLSSHAPPSDNDSPGERCILGIKMLTKEIVFRLPVSDIHSHGIDRLLFVHNVKRESVSILSIGTKASADIAFWDVENQEVDFVLDLSCGVDFSCVAPAHKVLVCGSADSGTIMIINLARGTIDQTIHADEYVGMTDLVVQGDNIFLGSLSAGVVVISMTQNSAVANLVVGQNLCVSPHVYPTKLLSSSLVEGSLFVGYSDGAIRVFDISSETAVCCLEGHTLAVNSLLLAPAGRLISSSSDGSAIMWNYEIGITARSGLESSRSENNDSVRTQRDLPAASVANLDDTFDVSCFVFNRDETWLITGSKSGMIAIWDVHSGSLLKTISRPSDRSIDSLYLVFKEQFLVAECSKEVTAGVKNLQLWNIETSESIKLQEEDVLVFCTRPFPSDDRLLTIGPCVDSTQSGIILTTHDLQQMRISSILHCNIYGDMDATNLRIIGFSAKSPDRSLNRSSAASKRSNILSKPAPSGKIAAGTIPRTLNVGKEKEVTALSEGMFFVLGYFPRRDASFFFTFFVDATDTLSMDRNDAMHIDTLGPECCVLSSLGGASICGTVQGSIVRWNVRNRKVDGELVDASLARPKSHDGSVSHGSAHDGPISCVQTDSTFQLLVTGGVTDRKVKLWNLSTKELISTLSAHNATITALHVTVDRNLFLSSSSDGTLCIWEKSSSSSKTYRRIGIFHLHGNASSVAMTMDRQRVATIIRLSPFGRPALLLLRTINI